MSGEVLVTGATGFIGAHLSARLLDEGHRLTIVARRPDGANARALAARGARIVAADLVDRERLLRETGKTAWEAIFHLGANVSLSGDEVRRVNVDGTANVLAVAEASGARYLAFASSIEATGLGAPSELPLDEDHPCRPPTPYGESKCAGEALVATFAERTGVPALIARIGNTYGPGSLGFFHFFLRLLLTDDPAVAALPLLGPRLLQPIYVADLVEAFVRALRMRLAGVYNFTGDAPASIGDWLLVLGALLGVEDLASARLAPKAPPASALLASPEVAYFLLGDGPRIHRAFTDARLRAALGEYQRHTLERGCAATLAWYGAAGVLAPLLR
jgi:nucleoside-diphosphate-sugar epimerase